MKYHQVVNSLQILFLCSFFNNFSNVYKLAPSYPLGLKCAVFSHLTTAQTIFQKSHLFLLVFHHFQTHFLIPVENTLSPANYLVPSLSRKVFVFSKHPAPLCLLRKSSRFVMKFVFIRIRWKERATRNHRLTSPSIAIWTKDYLPLREDPRRPETVFVK